MKLSVSFLKENFSFHRELDRSKNFFEKRVFLCYSMKTQEGVSGRESEKLRGDVNFNNFSE